ncbi:carbohydrate kinase family protein [Candidatus Peregrinibacteria bacterium]|nr:carbohydrate kinase family protein [Candidatus Peregrinibacteria bacterium]
MRSPKIFTIGGATFDIFVQAQDQSIFSVRTPNSFKKWLSFPHGSKVKVNKVMESFGGGATNTAVTFARHGLEVYFVGKVGQQYGDRVFDNLEKEGVDCRFAKQTSRDQTGFSTIINTFDGDRTLLAYPGANQYFTAKDLPVEELKKADWIFLNHLAGGGEDIHKVLLKILKANPKIKLAWNPGHEQIKQGAKKWRELLARTTILFVNKEEAASFSRVSYQLAGMKRDDPKAHEFSHRALLPPYADDVTEILRFFTDIGVKYTVITDGRNGSQATDGKSHYFCPVLSHRRVDTLGAGDAFASGFTVAMAKRLPLKTALTYGTLNAGNAVMHPGAQNGLLNAKQMKTALKKSEIKVKSTKL